MEMKKNPTKIYIMQVVNFDWNSLLPCHITFIYILIVVLRFMYSHIFVATLKQKDPRTG